MTSVSSPTVRIGCMECPGFRVRMRDLHAPTPHFFQPLRPLIGFPNAGEIQPAQLMVLLGPLASPSCALSTNANSSSLLPSIDLPNTTAIPTAHCVKFTPSLVIIHSLATCLRTLLLSQLVPSNSIQLTNSLHHSRLLPAHFMSFLPFQTSNSTLAPPIFSPYLPLARQNASSRLQRFCRLINHPLNTPVSPILLSLTICPFTIYHKILSVSIIRTHHVD